MLRCVSLCLLLLVAAPAVAEVGGSPAARYSFVAVENGALRLDTATGEVSLCTAENGAPVCASATKNLPQSGNRVGLEHEIAALQARIAALESENAEASGVLPDDEAIDRVMSLAERMMRRFVAMVREMKSETDGEDL